MRQTRTSGAVPGGFERCGRGAQGRSPWGRGPAVAGRCGEQGEQLADLVLGLGRVPEVHFGLGWGIVTGMRQVYGAAVDPHAYGTGDKTTHNTIAAPGLGADPLTTVVTGARGDLRVGLPCQAVSATAPTRNGWADHLPFHDPVRLMAVICAPTQRVEAVLDARPEVARLVLGSWIDLVAVDPTTGALSRRDPARGWAPIEATSPALESIRLAPTR